MTRFNDDVPQPIIVAAAKDRGKSVVDLLVHGANANTLEKLAYSVIRSSSSAQHRTGESLLDMIQKKLKALCNYKGEPEIISLKKTESLHDEKFYTRGLVVGSYHCWTALH